MAIAVRNVLENAVDASHERGRVDVAVRAEARDLLIEVRDYGTGVSDDIAPQIPTLFVTSKPDGLGLGLALSSAILEAHGGSLTWEQKDPGTCFTLRVPQARENAA
jgi:signal transduction histidine kinase